MLCIIVTAVSLNLQLNTSDDIDPCKAILSWYQTLLSLIYKANIWLF
jgi:hypothetical protein